MPQNPILVIKAPILQGPRVQGESDVFNSELFSGDGLGFRAEHPNVE